MSASLWGLGTSRADQMRLIFPLRYMQMKGWRQKMLENKKERTPEGVRSGTPEGTRLRFRPGRGENEGAAPSSRRR